MPLTPPPSPFSVNETPPSRRLVVLGAVLVAHLLLLLVWVGRRQPVATRPAGDTAAAEAPPDLHAPVREAPARFPPNTCLPDVRETEACGAIDLATFSPGRDLVFVDDHRVWWESDAKGGRDGECDHSMHRRLATPFRRLVELAAGCGARLKVHDAYRATGIHSPRSLHREGRAIDLTSDDISLEEVAKLAWQAGFDWVYHECPRSGGHHVHASVRRDATDLAASATSTVPRQAAAVSAADAGHASSRRRP